MSYVFDGLDIYSLPAVLLASFDRPEGPIEAGGFDELGNWVPQDAPQLVRTAGFGIDPGGNPYFDSAAVDLGDEAALFCDPSAGVVPGSLWLEAAR